MSSYAPTPDFTPAQPLVAAAGGCAICGNVGHTSEIHPLLEVLNRHTEFLAVIAGVLGQKTYRLAQQATANAGGFATITFPSFPGGVSKEWLVDRVLVKTNSSNAIACGIYILEGGQPGMAQDAPNALQAALPDLALHDFTNVAIAGGEQIKPLLVKGGEVLAVQWSGLSAAAFCTARVQYRQVWAGTD